MTQKSITQKAASFIRNVQRQDLTYGVQKNALSALADFVAVTIGGAEMPPAVKLRECVKTNAQQGASTILGTKMKLSVSDAVLLNGTASHALDYDDVSWTTIGHPTVTIAPVIFAYGELLEKSGTEILTAYVVGVEVQHRIAAALMPEVSDRGWHTTSVFGTVGAAAAASKLLELNQNQVANAIGISASLSGGVRANFGSMTKAVHAGIACQQGVNATEWARSGITSSVGAFEGNDGFAQVFSGKTIHSDDVKFDGPFDLERNGLVFKKYPCCSGSHTAIDTLSKILDNQPIHPEQISKINVGVSVVGPKELVCDCPQNAIEAKFSMQFALAARLVYGQLSLKEFTNEAVQNPSVQSLMKKVNMFVDNRYETLGFMNTSPSNMEIILKNGDQLKGECDLAKGNPDNPLTSDEMFEKFKLCTSKHLSDEQSEKAFIASMQLEDYDDINYYINLLRT